MLNKHKEQFFESLLKSQFLILSDSKKDTVKKLNPIILIKSLKQLIRLIQFNINNNKSNLIIQTEKRQLNQIIDFFNKRYPINAIISDNSRNIEASKILLLLNKSININKLFNNKYYITQIINNNSNLKNESIYNMFNNINDLSKLVFLLCIIRQIVEKKSKSLK